MNPFETPVLFLIFNRTDTTYKVFERIKLLKPKYLYVAADGPRAEKDEKDKCEITRGIATNVDWECKLKTLFRSENLGCGRAVSEAINWFFENVEEGIILEDDCLPDPSFFDYCTTMLRRYRNESKVMHISGVNFQNGVLRGSGSYYFSKYPHIWGWATWRRAWKKYDFQMLDWPDLSNVKTLRPHFKTDVEYLFWENIFNLTFQGQIDTWDYQWFYALVKNNGVSVIPNWNLVSNVGFGNAATHTHDGESRFSNMISEKYVLPDRISELLLDAEADEYTYNQVFNFRPESVRKLSFFLGTGNLIRKCLRTILTSR
ncbi:nucleotide-diphospho-sugar transferase [Pontibacter sp. MBLB2868]|uniref:nucleotide-diphospho-sugar transferase n=1 Tax=Pontibacter sp. MBLB2868 TaxID=3451555 RepID=UPI003F74FE48